MVFVYDFFPGSETLMSRHFNNPNHQLNGYSSPYNLDGMARPYSAGKGTYFCELHNMVSNYVKNQQILLMIDECDLQTRCLGLLSNRSTFRPQLGPLLHYQPQLFISGQ